MTMKISKSTVISTALAAIMAGSLAGGVAACTGATKTVTTPGATVTKTVPVPGPVVTKEVPAPPPPAGTQIGSWSGTGNAHTPSFNAPASGNYVVSWTYSGNSDQFGGSNFAIEATDPDAYTGSLPNDIASSGSGSTEI